MPQLNEKTLTPVHSKPRWKLSLSLIALAIAAVGLFVVANPSENTQAEPFASCNTNGILFQYPGGTDTQVHLIDMVTGDDSTPATISGRTINAIGYNVVDNFVYGWDNTANTLVRIHSDFSTVEAITIDDGGGGTVTPASTVIIGDVDENGYYWFIDGSGQNGHDYYGVDLNSGDTTVDLVSGIGTGTVSGVPAGNNAGADWAYVPGGTGLYRITHDTGANQGNLLVFDRDTGAFSSVGLIPQSELPSGDLKEGAFYADANGFLYASDNDDGNIYRVNVQTADATLFTSGPASGSNDGARCANAIIPIDFGDAPSSTYGTLLADDGPRHGVAGFNSSTNTAPLTLGKEIDIETDGFDTVGADGDDDNNIDDEKGVQHIVVESGVAAEVSVPVTVTNNSGSGATLAGWIDLDDDGTFETGERVTANIPASSGTGVYELAFPETTFTDSTYARFRVFSGSEADPQPTGSTTGGEVEDYPVQLGTFGVSKSADPPEGSAVGAGSIVTYTLTIQNTGSTDLDDLTIHDDLSDVLDDATLEGSPAVSPGSAGTASVDNSLLEFNGNTITAGQTVTVEYSVKINDAGSIGNTELNNFVLAAHSTNCHHEVSDGVATTSHPDCGTTHQVDTLADTGNGMILPLALAGGLLGVSGIALYFGRKYFSPHSKAPTANQK